MAQSEEQARWSHYYQALVGRPPRPLLIEALTSCGDGPTRWAADLGCGDGTETLALLEAGWHVLAIDQQSEAIQAETSRQKGVTLPVTTHWYNRW